VLTCRSQIHSLSLPVFHEPEEERAPVTGYFNKLEEKRRQRALLKQAASLTPPPPPTREMLHSKSHHLLPVESFNLDNKRISLDDWESELDRDSARSHSCKYAFGRRSLEKETPKGKSFEQKSWWADLEHASLN
jgi:hypothetical protein